MSYLYLSISICIGNYENLKSIFNYIVVLDDHINNKMNNLQ